MTTPNEATRTARTTSNDADNIDYKSELARKGIHLAGVLIPLVYYFIEWETALVLIGSLTLLSFLIEWARFRSPWFGRFFNRLFGVMLRKHESDEKKKTFSGATFVFIGAFVTILLFPKVIAIPAQILVVLGDSSAALVGRKIGKTPFLFKSLEGTLAFIVFGYLGTMLAPKLTGSPIEFAIVGAGAIVAAIAENVGVFIDDNLLVPTLSGLTMWLLYNLLMPGVPLDIPGVPG
jgi:dolichol kinase